ncbi:MAG: restriction endonuclease [Dehalococcoidia bacterium]|nr:restriction endonuclease [Dehalococcoidia bacterium]
MDKTLKQAEGAQFVQWFGPLLDALRALGGSGTPDEVVDKIADTLELPDEQLNEVTPSGELRFRNQVAWGRFYLVREGLLDSSRRGVWSITDKGRSASLSPEDSRAIFLKWVRIFSEERKRKKGVSEPPEEQVGEGTGAPSRNYRERVLEIFRSLPPDGFERLSQRLLRESGFTQVTVTGRSGDGGIDGYGTLQVNPLVSFRVLFQCKKYEKAVSPSHIRDFRGAMTGRADKGIIITTGTFTAEARREASRDGAPPLELIDGEKLIDLLQELELGLTPVKTFEVEEKFFSEFGLSSETNNLRKPTPKGSVA